MRKWLTLTTFVLVSSLVSQVAWGFGGEPGEEIRPNVVEQYQPTESSPAPAPWVAQDEPVVDYQPSESAPQAAAPTGAKCTQTCYRPVMRTRDVTCRRPVCKYRDETRYCHVPVYNREKRVRQVTCWKVEMETVTRHVTTCTCQVDECGCAHYVPTVCEVPCQVPRQVAYTVDQEYEVVTCTMEKKEYTVKVPYQEWEEFTCTQQFCEWEPYEVELQCCVNPCCVTCGRNPCCCSPF